MCQPEKVQINTNIEQAKLEHSEYMIFYIIHFLPFSCALKIHMKKLPKLMFNQEDERDDREHRNDLQRKWRKNIPRTKMGTKSVCHCCL